MELNRSCITQSPKTISGYLGTSFHKTNLLVGSDTSHRKPDRFLSRLPCSFAAIDLQLIVTSNQDLEQLDAPFQPILEIMLHGITLHALKTQEQFFQLGFGLGLELIQELDIARFASRAIQSTKRSVSSLFDVLHHELVLGTELDAHGKRRLLFVGFTIWTSLLVEVPNGGPTSSTWIVRSTPNGYFAQVDIRKTNVFVPRKGLRGVVPRRRLLSSSASFRRSDPADKEGLARRNGFVDQSGEFTAAIDFRHGIKVAFGIDGLHCVVGNRQGSQQEKEEGPKGSMGNHI